MSVTNVSDSVIGSASPPVVRIPIKGEWFFNCFLLLPHEALAETN
jgi:hypothetical protein